MPNGKSGFFVVPSCLLHSTAQLCLLDGRSSETKESFLIHLFTGIPVYQPLTSHLSFYTSDGG